jgi:predicted Rossmann fold flavoprotein
MVQNRVIILGGGAAGYFAAVNISTNNVLLLEKSKNVLSKVKVSGGGRCNLTNSITEPSELVKYYPRGEKELLGPFTHFSSKDTVDWFEQQGVKLKKEADGRIFPVSNKSQTIVDCLLNLSDKKRIKTGYRLFC